MQFRKSESFDVPLEIDENSSPNGVYIRKNIVEDVYTNPETGVEKPVYHYDEAFVTWQEYSNYQVTTYSIENSSKKTEEEIIDNYTEELVNSGTLEQ